jgi:hypothetical protein
MDRHDHRGDGMKEQSMRVARHAEPMKRLDKLAILALRRVRGMSANADRIAKSLLHSFENGQPITVRQRFALYSICWRFRRQIPMDVQVKVTIALAEAKAAAEEIRMDVPAESNIRAARSIDPMKAPAAAKRNPLDDLFPETVQQ